MRQREAPRSEQVAPRPSPIVASRKKHTRRAHLLHAHRNQPLRAVKVGGLGPRISAFHAAPSAKYFRRKAGAVLERQDSRDVSIGERSERGRETACCREGLAPIKGGIASEPAVL